MSTTEDGARAALRLGSEYVLRSLRMLSELMDGEVVTAVVALAIGQANVAHLDSADGDDGYRHTDTVPPDDVRRPVSVLSLSGSLGLPYETTRRHVEKLVQAGVCEKIKGGVIIPARTIDSDWHRDALAAHMGSLRRLFRGLKAAGFDFS